MPSPMTKKRLLLKVVLRYPKEDFCKQLKQRHSTGWQEYICPHGPGGREPPSPDERCPFPHSRAVPLGARQWGLDIEKDEHPSVTIADGMSLVQKMKGKNIHYLNMQTQH